MLKLTCCLSLYTVIQNCVICSHHLLKIRFFPLATRSEERSKLDNHAQLAMSRMKNLESLVWARDKLLNPDLLRSISQLPQISSLVLSGHAHHYYNPCLIGGMNFLKLLDVVAALAMRASRSLKELSIKKTKGDILELSLDALPNCMLLNFTSCPPMPNLRFLSLSTAASDHVSVTTVTSPDLPQLLCCPALDMLNLAISSSKRFMPLNAWQVFQEQLLKRSMCLSLTNFVVELSKVLDFILDVNLALEELYVLVTSPEVVTKWFSSIK
ncbi:uncharacterized protein L203_104842 [Cryptococcus depauperatus CBS 7841]|uniref:Uncharacterized protein n=1 Tax=Cryptococcus depauperatus CBS 7841 TaxID=1295531 RepID=A0AAJ8JWI2_9TREE